MAANIMQTPARVAQAAAPADSASTGATVPGEEAPVLPADSALDSLVGDSLPFDSLSKDTIVIDSLRQAIIARNKAVDDSLRADSINRTKSGTIDMPVNYEAKDSVVYFADIKRAFLYGSSNVKYDNMDLTAAKINMSLDSSIVHATGAMDTAKKERYGLPVFQMGSDKYETDTMAFNFKSKRGLIQNAYTEQDGGFLVSEKSKRDAEGNFYLKRGRYTTCDDSNPDFYLALTRAKVRPGKEVIFGPAYLVVQDVPLPLAIPYGFFPFTKSNYASGFIMPTYGDDSNKGFYLRDGGYYFAISDKIDLKLLGEIYTKGSWGISAASNYKVRYKFSGQFYASYLDSRSGDEGFPDYSKQTSFKIQWSHRQDTKANPYSSLSASVNFATSSYESSNLTSFYNPTTRTQSTRTSSVAWSTQFSSIGLSLSSALNLSQNMRDSTIDVSFPSLDIRLNRMYPFKRKRQVGNEKWYEKINFSYSGQLKNSISTKENKLFHSSLARDWQNYFSHTVPIQGNFTVLKYLNITPSVTLKDMMYTYKVKRSWDVENQKEVCDTVSGFNNVLTWNGSVTANTTLYGYFVPNRKLFGDKIQAIRHTFKPQVSFTYSPDFSSSRYGYYGTYTKTDKDGNVTYQDYSYYQGMSGSPSQGMQGTVNMSIDNNIEMKVKSDKDSTGYKKISIIDQLSANLSYNMAAKQKNWGDLSMTLQLKWWKNYTFRSNFVFATYAYELDENGNLYESNHTEWSKGRFGRFQGTTQTISYTLNPEKLCKIFGRGKDKDKKSKDDTKKSDSDTGVESNVDDKMVAATKGAENQSGSMAETDADGYLKFSMPWSLTFSYGISMSEDRSASGFNPETGRFPYRFTQNLNFSGNIRIADGWNISFSSGYDFNYHKLSMTTASLARDLHCFSMSCSVVISPYTSYNFSFRCNAATLTDALKYDKRSSSSNSIRWY